MIKHISRIGLVVIGACLLLTACEPTDWDSVIDPPAPVANLNATNAAGAKVDLTYDLPALDPFYGGSDGFFVDYYVRPSGGSVEIFFGGRFHVAAEAGTTVTVVSVDVDVTPALAAGNHVFVVYQIDPEFQKSPPAENTLNGYDPS